MPITLVTGKPRNGKTLYTLTKIREWFPGRQVYYRKIKDLDESHFGFKPLTDDMLRKWWELPPQSVLLVDECHYDFPSRTQGTPPEWIARLTEHGHYGLDFVLITQHPMNMDVFVRRLCQPHYHVKRIWGSQRASILRGDEYMDPDDRFARMNAEKSVFKYPKEVFGTYHSAEAHTVKRHIPRRVYVLGAVGVGILAGIGYVTSWMLSDRAAVATQRAAPAGSTRPGQVAGPAMAASMPVGLVTRVAFMPRDTLFPDSAPAFDRVRLPVTVAPRVAGCWSAGPEHCECRNQQGYRIAFTPDQCRYHLTQTFNPYAPAATASAPSSGGVPALGAAQVAAAALGVKPEP